jgi:hypothetical protein
MASSFAVCFLPREFSRSSDPSRQHKTLVSLVKTLVDLRERRAIRATRCITSDSGRIDRCQASDLPWRDPVA